MLQQRELRGMGVRVRAVAALLRVFLSACFGARQSFVSQHGGKEATSKRLTTSRFSATLPQVDLKWLLTEVAFLSV